MKLAHVGYVLEKGEFVQHAGPDPSVFQVVFSDPANIMLMAVTAIAAIIGYWLISKTSFKKNLSKRFAKKEKDYTALIPWMIRLTLGIALIGAGTSHVLISPVLETSSVVGFVELVLGFSLMLGFALFPVTLAVLALYVVALVQDLYIIGNLDFLALGLVFLCYANPRPGVDDLFGIPFPRISDIFCKFDTLTLRIAIGIAMIYLAVYEKLLNPNAMVEVIEKFELTSVVPVSAEMWTVSSGIIEAFIGLVILLGFKTRVMSMVAFGVLILSFFFFKEDVYSHVTLFGLLSILIVKGSGRVSLDAVLRRKK